MSFKRRDEDFEDAYEEIEQTKQDISLLVNNAYSGSTTSNSSNETNTQPICEEDNSFVETNVGGSHSDKLPPDKVQSLNYKLRNADNDDTCEESVLFIDDSVSSITETPFSSLQLIDTESRKVVVHEHIDDKLKSLPRSKNNVETKPNLQTQPEINGGKETDTILEDNDKLHEVKIEDTSLTIEPKQMETAFIDSSKQQTKARNIEGKEVNAVHETFDVENTLKRANNDNTVNTKQTKKYQGLTLMKIDKLWCLCFKEIVTILPKLLNSDEGIALEVIEESAFLVTSDGSLFEVKLENDSIQVVALDQATILHQDGAEQNDENVSMSDTATANDIKLQPSDVPDMPIDKDMDLEFRPNASETTIPVTARQLKRYEGLTLKKTNSQCSLCYKKINKKLSAPFIGDEGLALEVLEDSAFLVTSDGCLFEVKVDNTTIKVESLDQAVVLPQDDTNDKEEQPPRQESTDNKAVKSHPNSVLLRTTDENTALQESEKDRLDSQNDGGSNSQRQVPHVEAIHNFTNETDGKDVNTNKKSETDDKAKAVIDDECAEPELKKPFRTKLTKEDVEVNSSIDKDQSNVQKHEVNDNNSSNEHLPRSLVPDNMAYNIKEHQLTNTNYETEMNNSIAFQENQQHPVIADEAFRDMNKHTIHNASTSIHEDNVTQSETVLPINFGHPYESANKECGEIGKCTGRSKPNSNNDQVQNEFQTRNTDLNESVLKQQKHFGCNANVTDFNKNIHGKPIHTVIPDPETRNVLPNSKDELNQSHGVDVNVQKTSGSANRAVSGDKLEQTHQDQEPSIGIEFIVTYPDVNGKNSVTQRMKRESSIEDFMKWKYVMHSHLVQLDVGLFMTSACSVRISLEDGRICFKRYMSTDKLNHVLDVLMGKLSIMDLTVRVISVKNDPQLRVQKMMTSGFAHSNHLYADILGDSVCVVYEAEKAPSIEDFFRKEVFKEIELNFDCKSNSCKSMVSNGNATKIVISMPQFWAKLASKTGVVGDLEKQFPTLNVIAAETAASFDIIFIGKEKQIEHAKAYFDSEYCKKLITKPLIVRIDKTNAFTKTNLIEIAQSHIETCRCIVVLQTTPREGFTLYGFADDEVRRAASKLSKLITEEKYILTGNFRNMDVINPIINDIQRRYQGVLLTIDKTGATVYVTGYKDNVTKTLNDLKMKLEDDGAIDASRFEKKVVIEERDAYVVLVNDTNFQAEIKEHYGVRMSTLQRQDELGFLLTGKISQVFKCEEAVQKYVHNFVTERLKVSEEHDIECLNKKPIFSNAESECKVKIVKEPASIQKIEIDETKEDRKTWLFPGGQKIVLYRKAVSESEADIVVSHIDVSQYPGMRMRRGVQSGVAYDVLIPFFTNGLSREEFSAMNAFRQILETAAKDKETAVAFPLEAVRSWNMSSLSTCLVKCIGQFFLGQESRMKPSFALLCSDDAELYKLYFDWCKSAIHELETEISNELALTKQQPVQIKVVVGSLNNTQADVIVNTTAINLDLKTGAVSSAILKSAGQGLQNECKSRYPNGIKHGQIAVTGGHNLKCEFVFHGSIPGFNKNNPASSMQHVRNFVNNCLYEANELKFVSIAFPAIGAGNLNYPVDIVAEEMFNEVLRFQQKTMSDISLEEVKFVIYDQDKNAIQEFKKREKKLNQIEPEVGKEFEKRSMTVPVMGGKENVQDAKRQIQETPSQEQNWNKQAENQPKKVDIGVHIQRDHIETSTSSNAPTVPLRTYADAAARPKTKNAPVVTTQPSSVAPSDVFVCYTTKQVAIRVYRKNIFDLNVDCIVNPANEYLKHTTGLAKVIADRAGDDLIKESTAYNTQYNTIRVGNAVATTAGKLHYKCVVHAVGPVWPSKSSHSSSVECFRRDLQNTIFQCLVIAEQRQMTSIAFPSVSAGVFGVSKEVCATAYADAIIAYEVGTGFVNKKLKEIHFVDREISMVDIIKHTMNVMIKERKPCPHSFQTSISTIPTTLVDNDRFVKDSVGGMNDTTTKKPAQQHDKKFPFYRKHGGKLVCEFSNCHTIQIYSGDLFAIQGVKAIACGEDATGDAQGYVANKLKQLGKYSYEQVKKSAFNSSKPIKVGDVIISRGGQNKFEWILHAIVPLRQHFKSDTEWKKPYRKTFDRIFGEAARTGLTSVVLSLLGTGRGSSDVKRCAEIFLDSYDVACNRHFGKQLTVHMVNNETPKTEYLTKLFKDHIDKTKAYRVADTPFTHGLTISVDHKDSGAGRKVVYTPKPKGDISQQEHDKSPNQSGAPNYSPPVTRSSSHTENCPICLNGIKRPKTLICRHTFCTDCIDQHFKIKKVCPICGHICGVLIGDQPPGDMEIKKTNDHLSGFSQQCMALSLTYTFQDGKQQANHPNPGSRYSGFKRIAFLPDTDVGRQICAMLSVAFKRKLVFTIGRSNTTGGEGVITWNDIHHKTSSKPYATHGYPDHGYFDRVRGELKSKGITEADVDKGFLGKLKVLHIYGTVKV